MQRVRGPLAINASYSIGTVVVWLLVAGLVVLAVGYVATPRGRLDLRSLLAADVPSTAAALVAVDRALPLPRPGETILARAHVLMAGGHLHEALAARDLAQFLEMGRHQDSNAWIRAFRQFARAKITGKS